MGKNNAESRSFGIHLKEKCLAAIVPRVIAAQIGAAEGVPVGAERAELRIITRWVVIGGTAPWAETIPIVRVTIAVRASALETIPLGDLDQRRNLRVGRRRRGRRIVVGAAESGH